MALGQSKKTSEGWQVGEWLPTTLAEGASSSWRFKPQISSLFKPREPIWGFRTGVDSAVSVMTFCFSFSLGFPEEAYPKGLWIHRKPGFPQKEIRYLLKNPSKIHQNHHLSQNPKKPPTPPPKKNIYLYSSPAPAPYAFNLSKTPQKPPHPMGLLCALGVLVRMPLDEQVLDLGLHNEQNDQGQRCGVRAADIGRKKSPGRHWKV